MSNGPSPNLKDDYTFTVRRDANHVNNEREKWKLKLFNKQEFSIRQNTNANERPIVVRHSRVCQTR